jgi:3-oxoacyl-[acyl-carrier-protein] synthase II
VTAVLTGLGLAVAGLHDAGDLLGARPDTGGFDPVTALTGRDLRHKDRASRLALRAVEPALLDAGLLGPAYTGPPDATAVVVSSNLGNLDTVCEFADIVARDTVTGLSPLGLPHTSSNVIAGWVAIRYGLRGPNVTVCNGPTGGLDALYWARNLVAAGRAEIAVVVGVEPDTAVVARLLGEAGARTWLDGAAAVVVESAGHARQRGVRPRAVLAGYARAGDLGAAVTAARGPDPAPVGLWLTGDPGMPAGGATMDLTTRLGRCEGALGVLQCAAGVAYLDGGGAGGVLATAGGADGDDAAAALLVTGPGADA